MTQKIENKADKSPGIDGTVHLGSPSDLSIKQDRPQIADKGKLEAALSNMSSLDARLAKLNDASGPFGESDVDFSSGRVDALLDVPNIAEPPADNAVFPDVEVPSDTDETDISLDEHLGRNAQDEGAEGYLGFDTDKSNTSEKIAVTPIQNGELAARLDNGYKESLGDFLNEIPENELADINEDPIDNMVDTALAAQEDYVEVLSEEVSDETSSDIDEGTSPFAALFGSLDEAPVDFTDDGVEDDTSETVEDVEDEAPVDIEIDDYLFFDDFPPAAVSGETDNVISLPGADTFENDDFPIAEGLSDVDDWISEEDLTEETSESSDDPHEGLPQLTMGGDEDMFAPGTGYADEDNDPKSMGEEPFEDPDLGEMDDYDKNDDIDEKDDHMANSVGGSDDVEKTDDVNTFETEGLEGLDDLLDGVDVEVDIKDDTPMKDETVVDESAADDIFGSDDDEAADPQIAAMSETSIEEEPDMADAEAAEDIASTEEPVAKSGKMKALMLTAASVAVLGGGIGFAAFNGMIPGVDLAGSSANPVQPPVVVADNTSDTSTTTLPPVDVPVVSIEDLGLPGDVNEDITGEFNQALNDPIAEDEPGTISLSDLMASNDVSDAVDDVSEDLAGLTDPLEDAVEDLTSDISDLELENPVITTDLTDLVDEVSNDISDLAASVEGETDEVISHLDDASGEITSDLRALGDEVGTVSDEVDVFDPISELAAQIQGGGNTTDDEPEDVADANNTGSLFVEEARVIAVEDDVTEMALQMESMTSELSQLNDLILQSMERSSVIVDRVESNERSLRGVSAILTELAKTGESLDQTQIVLLDIAARVGSLESSNPADRSEVSEALRQIDDEMKRLTANMAILARMTVNGVGALQAEGASSGNAAVQTTQAELPSVGSNIVFADDTSVTPPVAAETTLQSSDIPSSVSEGDFVDGYGYVLDIVPASGNQNLVVMENGSVLVPK